ncbi:methyltransferase domain-containing protein [Candidatus Woesearchaeota archaeon]|nr:methyltransferase domain-containing protein [Candidatus Woesearchaeota archaeon]
MEKFHRYRWDWIINRIGTGKKVLNLGGIAKEEKAKIEARNNKVVDIDFFDRGSDIIANLENGIPQKDNSYDVVIAGEIIEHMTNPIFFVVECHRVLKDNGIFVLTTPNICGIKSRIYMIFGKLPSNCANAYSSHLKDFNVKLLKKIVSECGFNIKDEDTKVISLSPNRLIKWEFSLYFPFNIGNFADNIFIIGIKRDKMNLSKETEHCLEYYSRLTDYRK